MYNIGICDDEKYTCADIEELIYKYAKQKRISVNIEIWFSGNILCNYLKSGNKLDIIFLDIELVEMTGVEVGSFIRNELEDYSTYIIFISSKTNYAMKLFEFQPLDFLVKPITFRQIASILDKGIYLLEKDNLFFEFTVGNSLNRVLYKDIEYMCSNKRKITIVLQNGSFEFYGKLRSILPMLPKNFIMVQQSYIINQNFVSEYQYDSIKMQSGDIITISRSLRKEIRERIMEFKTDRRNRDV